MSQGIVEAAIDKALSFVDSNTSVMIIRSEEQLNAVLDRISYHVDDYEIAEGAIPPERVRQILGSRNFLGTKSAT
jgi:hypothetical protein